MSAVLATSAMTVSKYLICFLRKGINNSLHERPSDREETSSLRTGLMLVHRWPGLQTAMTRSLALCVRCPFPRKWFQVCAPHLCIYVLFQKDYSEMSFPCRICIYFMQKSVSICFKALRVLISTTYVI